MGLSYNPTIVPDGLIYYLDAANTRTYPGTGNTWYDLSGFGNNGTLNNGVLYNSYGGFFEFDGSNDYVQTGYTGISGNNSRTVEAWIKTTVNSDPSTGAAQHVIVDWGTTATGGRFTLNILWGNTLRIEVGGSGINGKTVLNDGNWHHVAASYDPSATYKFCLYVDGVLDTSANNTTTVNTTSGNTLIIGKRVDNVTPASTAAYYTNTIIDALNTFGFAIPNISES